MDVDGRSVRILLVDGHSLFRQAVVGVLGGERGVEVVAEAEGEADALAMLSRSHPDVAFVDADPFDGDVATTIARMKDISPQCKILILTSHEQLDPIVEALQAGASGYLTKDASIADLVRAAHSAHDGEVVVPPEVMGKLLIALLDHRGHRDEALEQLSRLTRREREVLALLAQGADKDMIAERLVISPETARTHVQNILAKLDVHSRLEAAAFARRIHLVPDLVDSPSAGA